MASAAIRWTRGFLETPIVGSRDGADTDYGWQLSKAWSGCPDLEWTTGVMPERVTAMAGRVRAYFYEDVRDFETVRVMLRVGSNLRSERAEAVGGRGHFEYPTVALGLSLFRVSLSITRRTYPHADTGRAIQGSTLRGRHRWRGHAEDSLHE